MKDNNILGFETSEELENALQDARNKAEGTFLSAAYGFDNAYHNIILKDDNSGEDVNLSDLYEDVMTAEKKDNDKARRLLKLIDRALKGIGSAGALGIFLTGMKTNILKELGESYNAKKVEKVVYPIDKVDNNIWNYLTSADASGQLAFNFSKSINDKEVAILYSINFDELEKKGLAISKQLTPYDKRVYIAIAALFNAGNDKFTIRQVHFAMGGTDEPSANQISKIDNSIKKMRYASILLDNAPEFQSGSKYPKFFYEGQLLPLESITAVVRGVVVDKAYHVLREPPVLTFARARKQISTFNIDLLQNKKLSKTDANLRLEDFFIERISRAKNGNMHRTIVIDSLYKELSVASSTDKKRTYDKIIKCLDYFVGCKFISKYYFVGTGDKVLKQNDANYTNALKIKFDF